MTEGALLNLGFKKISEYPGFANVYRHDEKDSLWIYSTGDVQLRTPFIRAIKNEKELISVYSAMGIAINL